MGSASIHADNSAARQASLAAGLVVEWKIFDSLSTYIAGREAELQRKRLASAEARVKYLVATDVRFAYASLKAAIERRRSLKEAQEAATAGVEIIRRRYKAGTALLIEMLQAQDELEQIELDLVTNAIDIAQGQGELSGAVGKPTGR